MFTGIIEKTGKVTGLSSSKLEVQVGHNFNVKLGDSVCVSGVCLTASNMDGERISFDVSHESLSVTALKNLKSNDVVNLERAMPADGRFGGHFVTGHVDSVGTVRKAGVDMHIEFDTKYSKFLVDKGSVSINGVSLTVNEVKGKVFRLTLIPYTLKETNLLDLKVGETVNIEFDVLAKYVANMLSNETTKNETKSNLTEEKLRSYGYVK
jgi:riboflavin synthase